MLQQQTQYRTHTDKPTNGCKSEVLTKCQVRIAFHSTTKPRSSLAITLASKLPQTSINSSTLWCSDFSLIANFFSLHSTYVTISGFPANFLD